LKGREFIRRVGVEGKQEKAFVRDQRASRM